MKTINTTKILLKSIDIELKKLLANDLKNHYTQTLKAGINQGTQKAA